MGAYSQDGIGRGSDTELQRDRPWDNGDGSVNTEGRGQGGPRGLAGQGPAGGPRADITPHDPRALPMGSSLPNNTSEAQYGHSGGSARLGHSIRQLWKYLGNVTVHHAAHRELSSLSSLRTQATSRPSSTPRSLTQYPTTNHPSSHSK